jgi:flavorubredoxin
MSTAANDRRVIQLEIEPGLVCLRGLSPKRLRFEVEYGLERGTTANSFLFLPSGDDPALLVHPPGNTFAEPYLQSLASLVPTDARLQVVVGHTNPNRVMLLRQLAQRWPLLELISSNPGAQLLKELWDQRKPTPPGAAATEEPEALPPLPPLQVVRGELELQRADGHSLQLLPTPTPRWPGGLMAFEATSGLLMSGKFFAAHLCSETWAEANRSSTEEDRRYFYDCLMAPMVRQVETVLDRIDELPIRTIAPGHRRELAQPAGGLPPLGRNPGAGQALGGTAVCQRLWQHGRHCRWPGPGRGAHRRAGGEHQL